MKELYSNLSKLILIWLLAIFLIASCGRSTYAVDLSKNISVTPQRHCGFIVPKFCIGSQSMQKTGTSVSATHTRLYSLYEGMTQQNKSAMANMLGGTDIPRVNPLTSFKHGEISQNSKISGGNHHA
jgi:hypothetical protein